MFVFFVRSWKKNLPADSHTTASLIFLVPLQLIPIEKLFSIRDSIRKATEFFFCFFFQLKKTIDPDGLNIHEETECSPFMLSDYLI